MWSICLPTAATATISLRLLAASRTITLVKILRGGSLRDHPPAKGSLPRHALAWQWSRKAVPRRIVALPPRTSNTHVPSSKTFATSGSDLTGNGDNFLYGFLASSQNVSISPIVRSLSSHRNSPITGYTGIKAFSFSSLCFLLKASGTWDWDLDCSVPWNNIFCLLLFAVNKYLPHLGEPMSEQ